MSICSNPDDMLSDLLDEVADGDPSFDGPEEDLYSGSESDRSIIETREKPKTFLRPRRNAVCADPITTGYYKEPFWNKQESWDAILFKIIQGRSVFKGFSTAELLMIVRVMSSHFYYGGEKIYEQGDVGDAMLIVLSGTVDCYRNEVGSKTPKLVTSLPNNSVIDEIALAWNTPRSFSAVAREQCILIRLTRNHFMNATIRTGVYRWWGRQGYLRAASLLEMMEDEQIAKLVDVIKIKRFEAGQQIIRFGDVGNCFYILNSGECRCWIVQGGEDQEIRRYHAGELFGELALLMNRPRAANITAVTNCECLMLTRGQFERILGPMGQLHQQQYLTDPRKLIADFYGPSDDRGPLGTLTLQGLEPDPSRGQSSWFVVYRPTSKDAIAKMLSGNAVGKGLNVKGKSAKQGVLSGFVPFLQISDNKHKSMIEQSPPNARLVIYYKSSAARDEARKTLQHVLDDTPIKMQRREIEVLDDKYQDPDRKPKVYGLNIPEPLLREAYIIRPDLSPVMGWEVGRRSEPAFMDMNLHAIRDDSEPKVVLYQYDESDAMNPRGLLIAYAEEMCKPVVSDFDTFCVASKGIEYKPLPPDQQGLITWGLDHLETILNSLDHNPWTSRWLAVLKKENERGFHPKFPKYGYGDDTSYKFIGDIVTVCQGSGAVRHGAECFNFYFPQELDDEYLVVWEGFQKAGSEKPWEYYSEKQMRQFLLDRIPEGYCFPLNPMWPIRDKGWKDVYDALLASPQAADYKAWYQGSNIVQRISEMSKLYPDGFEQRADKVVTKENSKNVECKKGILSGKTNNDLGQTASLGGLQNEIAARQRQKRDSKAITDASVQEALKKKGGKATACALQ